MAFSFSEFPDTAYYHSDLRQILIRLREIDDTLSKYDETIEALKKELANIGGLYTRVSALESATADLASLRTRLANVEKTVASIIAQEKNDVANLQKQIDDLKELVTNLVVEFNAVFKYIDANVSKLEFTIADNYRKLLEAIARVEYDCKLQIERLTARIDALDTSVRNPWRPQEGRLDQDTNMKYVYKDLADNVPTAREYAELGLTADRYAEYEMRAISYARFGKILLHCDWVYSPITGVVQDINNVLCNIINNHFGTISADAYTAKELTADEYSALELTAFGYYSYV